MKNFMRRLQHYFTIVSNYISPPLLAVLVIGIITSILLFIPPVNGLADNGNYYRILNGSGLYIQNIKDHSYLSYFQKEFSIMQYYNQSSSIFISSQQLFITLAIWLNKLFYSAHQFDIRFLGAVYLLCYLPGIYLLAKGLSAGLSKGRSYLVSLFVIFLLGDTSYTIYFNSFYSEATSLIASLYIFAAVIYLYRTKGFGKRGLIWLLLFINTIILLGVTKRQFSLIFGLLVMGLGLFAFTKSKGTRLALGAVLATFVGFLIMGTIFLPYSTREIDLYHSLTRGVMLETADPDSRMREGGINRQYGLEKGTTYFDEYSPVSPKSDQVKENFIGKAGTIWVVINYIYHPDEFNKLLDIAVQDVYFVKPSELGNYEEAAGGEPAQQTRFFTLYNRIKAAAYPKSFGFYILFSVALIGLYGVGFYNGVKEGKAGMIVRFFLITGFLVNMIFIFLSSIIIKGDSDLIRLLFLVSLYFDLISLLLWSDIVGKRIWNDEPVQKEGLEYETQI
ncbi:hypothetical protein [Enterococcus wangshanyuanii]|uniref:Glycosyltransferase RgtA/B/C/D-like domain-containing protein n=1 Tax=Enterococcus wangshanyuanii TaxID=2005703 RepID=A0ABQ1NPU4_9ENTE|nr:hypothetical protein [Enterococcus wangshanyuanii]GGC80039.1 hypothetical protein GCM10011573_07150 [Enterococcus wangshanyuanii]